MLKIPSLAQLQAKLRAAGIGGQPGGGGGGGGGGAAAANAGASKCPRKGDGWRIGGDDDIGDVDCPIPNCPVCGNGDGSGVASNPGAAGYTTKGKGPPLTKDAGTLLGSLIATIFLPDNRSNLDKFLDGLEQSPGAIDFEAPKDLRTVVQRLDLLQLNAHVNAFCIRKGAHNLKKHVPGAQKLAEEYGYSSTTFKRRLESGTCLAALCAASVAGMQLDFISAKKSAKQDIIALCMPDDKWGVLIQRLRIPLDLNFCYCVPIEAEGVPEVIQSAPFHSLIETDEIMEQINTNFATLPPRSRSWYELVEQWELSPNPGEVPLPEIRTIRTPEPLPKTPDLYRGAEKVAQEADIALNLDDLEDLTVIFLMCRNVLCLEDSAGKMLSDYFKLPPHLIRKVQDAIALVQAAMPGEWKTDESIRLLYSYLSCHYSWYSRFGEKVNILNFIQAMRLLRTLTIWIMSNAIMGAGSISVNVNRMNQRHY
ncbi:hypothetical protein K438DRAFT_1766445 [Mycena galopus ATCC 62051]|nr:hypothetical protein K438DRAFT_1766445 [Mycena galopus ATCC 62051]